MSALPSNTVSPGNVPVLRETPLRILYAGRFDIRAIDELCRAGQNPSQHLHAMPELRRHGYELRFLDNTSNLGLLAFNWAVFRLLLRGEIDAIVAHSLEDIRPLVLLRRLGIVRKPLLAFVHSYKPTRLNSFVACGVDKLLALNRTAIDRLFGSGVDKERIAEFPFGADKTFYRGSATDPRHILSVGVSGRDYDTLLTAANQLSFRFSVVGQVSAEQRARAGDTLEIVSSASYDQPFAKLFELYDQAHFVVITHHGSEHPYGVNALVEAMAMSKAVILTEGPGIDIDPVALGFGLKVPPHDPDALVNAMEYMMRNPSEVMRMGVRARALINERLNTEQMEMVLHASLCELLNPIQHG